MPQYYPIILTQDTEAFPNDFDIKRPSRCADSNIKSNRTEFIKEFHDSLNLDIKLKIKEFNTIILASYYITKIFPQLFY